MGWFLTSCIACANTFCGLPQFSFPFIIHKFADNKAINARDKIYALISISDDACNPRRFYLNNIKSKGYISRHDIEITICEDS